MNTIALNELMDTLQAMTPEQLERFLHHPSTVHIMEEARKGGANHD